MLLNKLYYNIFCFAIILTFYSAQGPFNLRLTDLAVLILIAISFLISYRKKDVVLLILIVGFFFLALANDMYYLLIQSDYSYQRPGGETGGVKYDRLGLYVKYVAFFSLLLALTNFQNNKKYSLITDSLKVRIKGSLVILYILLIIFLAYQYWSITPDRLSFPFSNSSIMWPQKTDGHVLGVTMAFLIAFIQVVFIKSLSNTLKFFLIIPGIIIMLLSGSSGGAALLVVFYALYFRFYSIIKFFIILLVIALLGSLFIDYSVLLSYFESTSVTRALSISRVIRENALTDDINRLTVHFFTFNVLVEQGRLFTGFGFLGMTHYYFDAFIPSLISPVGLLGLFLFVFFIALVYKKNMPINQEQRRVYKIFSLMFLLAILISEFHLVVRILLTMTACVYYFSNGNNFSNNNNSSL